MECLDAQELSFLDGALAFLGTADPGAVEALRLLAARLGEVDRAARAFPSLLDRASLGHLERSPESLVDRLCSAEPEMGALQMPVRAVMGEAFLIAKIQLLRAARLALRSSPTPAPEALLSAAQNEVSQSLYTKLLAELLLRLAQMTDLPAEVRRRAAMELVRLWDSPDRLEVDDFFPVLEAVWRARNRVTVTYGTLLCTSEFFHLMRAECPPVFVSFFTRDEVSEEENAAFQEFLLGLSQEEIEKLRQAMQAQGRQLIDGRFARETLGLAEAQEGDPEAVYVSHRRRQRAAASRRIMGLSGPRRTAEEYLVLYLLDHPGEGGSPTG
jgi:hypothetical protein